MSDGDVAALLERGIAQQRGGQHKAAIQIFQQVLKRGGASATVYCRLGASYEQLRDFQRADDAYVAAIELEPEASEPYLRAAELARRTSALAERVGQAATARELRRGAFHYLTALGVRLVRRGAWGEAETIFRRARSLAPDDWAVHVDLGRCLYELARHDDAEAEIRIGVRLGPRQALAHYYLGVLMRRRGRPSDAETALRQAVELDPGLAIAHAERGNMLFWLGRADDADAAFASAFALDPAVASGERLFLMGPIYHDVAPERIFARHLEWGANAVAAASISAIDAAPFANSRDPDRPLRVGYLSGDFREHSIAYFVEPLLRNHDRTAVEAFCYAEVRQPDETTERIHRLVPHWRATLGLSDEALRRLIRDDAIDIVIDLAGHTEGNRLAALAVRTAPVTASWLGYPTTTGLPTVDWRITDDRADPPGAEAYHTERLLRLPDGFLCYRPADDAPDVAPPPAAAAGCVTFGSFNNWLKTTPAVLEVWAEILRAVPKSRLLLKTLLLADASIRQAVGDRFAAAGVAPDRLDLRPGTRSRRDHLAAYGDVDIALDAFPYNGTTTTCEALWMGVPMVSLVGGRHSGRVGLSVLAQAGLAEFAAADTQHYVEAAARLAVDPAALAARRAAQREQVRQSGLCDGPRFARRFETALRQIWREWCRTGGSI